MTDRNPLNFDRRGEGPTLVLIHGIGSELCIWDPVMDELAAGHDVVAVDLPGFGRSAPLPDGIRPTPAALAGAVARSLDLLEIERAHAVGNSLGGWVALELARAGRASTVVGLCPAGLWGAPVLPAGAAVRGRAQRTVRRLRSLVPVAMAIPPVRRLALRPFLAHPERVPYSAAARMVRSYGRATAYAATSTAMRQDYLARPEEISVPVTLAFGQYDRLIRPTRRAFPGARTLLLPGCGHIPMWDDPELVISVIEETVAPGRGPAGSARRGPVPRTERGCRPADARRAADRGTCQHPHERGRSAAG